VTAPRFLVDENLSVTLPRVAHKRGFAATHVNHLGLRQWKDWNILDVVARDGWVLVTNNAIEFRARYVKLVSHPGVIFLLPSVGRPMQMTLFDAALDKVAIDVDLSNQALDVQLSRDDRIVIRRYHLGLSTLH
jgi:predicted nuclease of predicted toxin-antitoxin system